jgi:hypothetical protein
MSAPESPQSTAGPAAVDQPPTQPIDISSIVGSAAQG